MGMVDTLSRSVYLKKVGLLLGIDFTKAYDSVSYAFIIEQLLKLQLDPYLVRYV